MLFWFSMWFFQHSHGGFLVQHLAPCREVKDIMCWLSWFSWVMEIPATWSCWESRESATSCNGQVSFFRCVEMCYICLHSDLHMSYLYITLYVYVCLGICFHWKKLIMKPEDLWALMFRQTLSGPSLWPSWRDWWLDHIAMTYSNGTWPFNQFNHL